MKFLSCRGDLEVKGGKLYSLEHCVLGAYADDGGMFMPATVPQLTQAKLRDWSKLSFQQLVLEFLSLCIEESEVPRVHLQRIISNAFQAFTQTDGAGKEVINEISFEHLTLRDGARPVAVAELWHGHTLAFKDLPLQVLGGLLGHFLARKKTKINVLVGTSGDTGSAAIEAVRQSPWVNIFVLFPAGGRITQIQELQMTTARSEHNNVHVVACDGTSDDLDVPILECFEKDPDFARKYKLCSINSVNIIRILMQCTHFLYAYLHVCPDADRPVDFSLPTGAAGHIAAGVFTKHMGVPIGQLVAATNDNDLLATFLNTGEFRPRTTGAIQTSSPAIDIQVPYNVERMLYCMSPGTPAEKGLQVRTYLTSLTSPSRGFTLGPEEFQRWREFGLVGRRAGNEDVLRTIRENWKAQGEAFTMSFQIMDMHTISHLLLFWYRCRLPTRSAHLCRGARRPLPSLLLASHSPDDRGVLHCARREVPPDRECGDGGGPGATAGDLREESVCECQESDHAAPIGGEVDAVYKRRGLDRQAESAHRRGQPETGGRRTTTDSIEAVSLRLLRLFSSNNKFQLCRLVIAIHACRDHDLATSAHAQLAQSRERASCIRVEYQKELTSLYGILQSHLEH